VKKKRIGLAMSGGVDSTACAIILREQYEIEGFFMHIAQPDFILQKTRAAFIANKLGIKLNIIDLQSEFKQKVLDYFSSNYLNGITPNPCVVCNREIKFGLFMERILHHGINQIATGHYARIIEDNGIYRLYSGADPQKDQSYFLSRLNQIQLSRILFPLGDSRKDSTYTLVERHGFDDFRGLESQDVCFLEKNTINAFLEERSAESNNRGPILSTSGEHLGNHNGLFHYTIGQRKGLGISSNNPLYVIGLDKKHNSVIVGKKEELFKNIITIQALHWLAGTHPILDREYTIRIRYSHKGALATLTLDESENATIFFKEPQRAVAPGQFAVIYNGTELLGSGIIV